MPMLHDHGAAHLDSITSMCAMQVQFNSEEVSEVKWVDLVDLRADMAARPKAYTSWFRDEVEEAAWFGLGLGTTRAADN